MDEQISDGITEAEEIAALSDMDEAQALTGSEETVPVEEARKVLEKFKGPKGGVGSANMEFLTRPPKKRREKKDNMNPVKTGKKKSGKPDTDSGAPLVTKDKKNRTLQQQVAVTRVGVAAKKAVGKAGGTKIDVGSGRKVGTVATTPIARKSAVSGKAAPVKKTGIPVAMPKVSRKKSGEMPFCMCGCKERTKGGRFRPGHDARYYSALKKAGKATAGHGKTPGPQLVKAS